MKLQDIILNRTSTRHYDSTVIIPRQKILEAIDLAAKSPNGNNIQSTRYLLIEDRTLRNKLKKGAHNQKQVETASYLILILGDYRAFQATNIRRIEEQGFQKGYVTLETKMILTDAALA